MFVDVVKFLTDQKIDFRTSGANIGRNFIGIRVCPACGDRKFHLGVSKKTANFHCFKCSSKFWLFDYVVEQYKCTRQEAKRICFPYLDFNKSGVDEQVLERPSRIKLPLGATQNFPKAHLKYLEKRGFSFETIQRFSLSACHMLSTYKYRIIIPVLYDGKMVSFTGRAIAGQDPRYLHSPNEDSVIPVKQCLYNIDLATKHTIICEGAIDCWRLGTGSVATFGTKFTNRQLNVLRKNGCEKVTIIFDPDKGGRKATKELVTALDMIGIDAESYTLRDKDPGDLTEDEALDLRHEIYGRVL